MQNLAISYFYTVTIYWSSTHYICCYSICLFCWYNIYKSYNFITFDHWSIIFLKLLIIFTFTLACFIIPFLTGIACCSVEFAFTITWNMFFHCLSFIFVCYHIKRFNIYIFCFFWNTYFWGYEITTSNTFI